MNRREFFKTSAVTTTLLGLGAIGYKLPTYRTKNSVFSNEELTEWCKQNGGHYAQDDELVYASYQVYYQTKWANYFSPQLPNAYKTPNRSFRHFPFIILDDAPHTSLDLWVNDNRRIYPNTTFIIKDIYKADYKLTVRWTNGQMTTRDCYFMAFRREKLT